MANRYLAAAFVLTGASVLGIALHIRKKTRSQLHTYGSMLRQYFEYFILSMFGARMRQKLEIDSVNFANVQEETLVKILQSNANTDYGVMYEFGDIQDKNEYAVRHPLTRYSHYKDYIGEITFVCSL